MYLMVLQLVCQKQGLKPLFFLQCYYFILEFTKLISTSLSILSPPKKYTQTYYAAVPGG